MKEQMLKVLITFLLSRLKDEDVKKWADAGIDMLESAVVNSETRLDDEVVLPLCAVLRSAFNIPDNSN
jgi:hypothetical protein